MHFWNTRPDRPIVKFGGHVGGLVDEKSIGQKRSISIKLGYVVKLADKVLARNTAHNRSHSLMKNEIESLRRQVEDLKAEIVRLQQELKTSQQRSAIFHEKDTHLDSETALRESEERLRVAIEAARIGTYITNLEADRVYWSPELCDILGVQPGIERTREEAFKVVHKDDIAHALTVGRLALDPDGDGCFESEHRVVRPDGQVRWILWRGRTIFQIGRAHV
jgi:PAS domain S-box-containing protein